MVKHAAPRIEDAEAVALEEILAELSKHLSPTNENVRRGYVIAAIRDLAQAALSQRENADDAEAKVATLTDALEKYGAHDMNCGWIQRHGPAGVYADHVNDCTCGWEATIAVVKQGCSYAAIREPSSNDYP